jgi:DNA processing protein
MPLGVIVIEDAQYSGSPITAPLAMEFGREVCGVPGNVTPPVSFAEPIDQARRQARHKRGRRQESKHIDDIVERSGLNSSEVLATLFDLEMKGIARQSPGKRFSKVLFYKKFGRESLAPDPASKR